MGSYFENQLIVFYFLVEVSDSSCMNVNLMVFFSSMTVHRTYLECEQNKTFKETCFTIF